MNIIRKYHCTNYTFSHTALSFKLLIIGKCCLCACILTFTCGHAIIKRNAASVGVSPFGERKESAFLLPNEFLVLLKYLFNRLALPYHYNFEFSYIHRVEYPLT